MHAQLLRISRRQTCLMIASKLSCGSPHCVNVGDLTKAVKPDGSDKSPSSWIGKTLSKQAKACWATIFASKCRCRIA